MEERKQTDWSFKQHLALRTGTMLLAFSGALLALSFSGAAANSYAAHTSQHRYILAAEQRLCKISDNSRHLQPLFPGSVHS